MKLLAPAILAAIYLCQVEPSPAQPATAQPDASAPARGSAAHQNQPRTLETGRANARVSPDVISVRSFGAKCDGATDDTSSMNAALSYAGSSGGGVVTIPPGATCAYGETIVVPNGVTFRGEGWHSELKAATLNLAVGVQMGSGPSAASLEDLAINVGAAGSNVSGTAIDMGLATGSRVRNVFIQNPCVGISVSGNTPVVEGVQVKGVSNPQCSAIQVGARTIGAQTVDARITNSTLNCAAVAPGDADLAIYDSGGLFLQNDDFLFCANGLLIAPGANQQVIWTFGSNSALADSTTASGIVFDVRSDNAAIKGFTCVGCWSASGKGHGVWLKRSSSGLIDGIHFVALRDFNHSLDGFHIEAGSNITVDDSQICGFGQGRAATGFLVGPNVSDGALRNTTVKAVCDGNTKPPDGNSAFGVKFSGANANWIMVGDVVSGEMRPFDGAPRGAFTGDSSNTSSSPCLRLPPENSAATSWPVSCLNTEKHAGIPGEGSLALSHCGSNPILSPGSNDAVGEFAIGSGASHCTLGFKAGYGGHPTCIVADQTDMNRLRGYSISASSLSVTLGRAAADTIHYQCAALSTY